MRKSRIQVPTGVLSMISRLLLKCFFSLKIEGLEHLKNNQRSFILAGNHTGYLDSLLIYTAMRQDFSFLMTEEVFSWKLIGKLVRYGNILPLYQGKEKRVLLESLRLLRAGHPLCIFPEGKLTKTGVIQPFQEGLGFLQEKSGVEVIPFAIQGGFEAWGHDRLFPSLKYRKLQLVIGAPIKHDPRLTRRELTERVFQQVSTLYQCSRQPANEAPQTINQPIPIQ